MYSRWLRLLEFCGVTVVWLLVGCCGGGFIGSMIGSMIDGKLVVRK